MPGPKQMMISPIPLPNHLPNVFKPHKNFLVPKYSYFVIDQLDIPLPVSLPSPLFHFKEHSHANSKLTNHAPIFDFFSPTILRHLPGVGFHSYLQRLLQNSLFLPPKEIFCNQIDT